MFRIWFYDSGAEDAWQNWVNQQGDAFSLALFSGLGVREEAERENIRTKQKRIRNLCMKKGFWGGTWYLKVHLMRTGTIPVQYILLLNKLLKYLLCLVECCAPILAEWRVMVSVIIQRQERLKYHQDTDSNNIKELVYKQLYKLNPKYV